MEEFINYILKFGNLNKEQTDFIITKAKTLNFIKMNIFQKPERFPSRSVLYLKV